MKTRAPLMIAAVLLVACEAAGAGGGKKKEEKADADRVLGHGQAVAKAGVAEPSGIAFDAALGHLFVVGDEGTVSELDAQGGFVRATPVRGDLEDVAVHTPSGNLVLLDENGASLIVFDPRAQKEIARFKLDAQALVGKRPGTRNGFEGICFRPQAGRAGGGVFYLAHQSGPAMVLELAFDPMQPARTIGAESVLHRWGLPGQRDLNAVIWAESLQRLLVLSDTENALLVMNEKGAVEATIHVPGIQQEGACLDGGGDLWIADDKAGSVKRYAGALRAITAELGGAGGERRPKKKD